MGKKNIGDIKWSMEFVVSKGRYMQPHYMWGIIRRFDRVDARAFFEYGNEDKNGNDYYVWHSFMSLNKLRRVAPLVFKYFPEVKEIHVYKDIDIGDYADSKYRETIKR